MKEEKKADPASKDLLRQSATLKFAERRDPTRAL
jgi:hypothetical protein